MQLHPGAHTVVSLFGMQVNMDTIYMTWLAGAIVIFLMFLATRQKALVPSGWQNAVEIVMEGLCNQFRDNLGPRYRQAAYVLLTLFFFIFVSNQMGLLPTNHLIVSPTNDLNTTLGLAIFCSIMIHVLYIRNQGIGRWGKHFFKPFAPFVLINLIEEIARPVTLAMRLFGNILAGEILLEVLYDLAPYLVPIIWIAFSLFIGLIQAYIFTTLASAYLMESVAEEEH